MRIIVTGGAGFIGSHLCERLLKENHEVICIDNLITGSEKNLEESKKHPGFRFLNHDVIFPLPPDIEADAIFHLASPASPNHHSMISYHALAKETMLVNSQGTYNLLNFAKEKRLKFLFASTSEVYGDPLVSPQNEEYRGNVSTTGPRSVYDESKRFGETLTASFVREGVDARIVRLFNTYGTNMQKTDSRMVIAFTNQAITNKPITIFGDGSQTRALCYIQDTLEGLSRLMFYPNTAGEVVNIGSEDEHTVLEYANLIKKLAGSTSETIFSEQLPEDDPKQRRPDITKARNLLNWEPKIGLEQGLTTVINYFRSQTPWS